MNSRNTTILKLLGESNYDKNKIKRICPKCKIIKSLTTKHCIVCNICVEDFVHHCFWINKCINNKIYHQFFLFLIILLFDLIMNLFLFFVEIKYLFKEKSDRSVIFSIKVICLGFYLLVISLGIFIIFQILLDRIKGIIYSSNKKLNLEENLLNNKSYEDEDENKSNKSNKNNRINEDNNDMKIKEDNKGDKIDINNNIIINQ